MWIIPKNLHTSDFVPDTAALRLDSNELSEICARSLFVRSKPSPARTWSQKWKRDSWTALLSGRILKPSHGQSFVTAWTSSLVATPASHSAQPVNDSAQKTHDIFGPSSQAEFAFCDPNSVSLRMSKDTSALDSEKSLENWNQSVTRRRGEYSARVKSARLTSESGSSSWPSPIASEVRQGFQDRSRGMKGSQESLTTVVVKHGQAAPANWSTPNTLDMMPPKSMEGIQRVLTHDGRKNRKSTGNLREDVVQFGQAAPANPSTHGSRQGLWPTPEASSSCHGHGGTWSTTQFNLHNATMGVGILPPQWPIRQPDNKTQTTKERMAKRMGKQWATPIIGDSHLASTPEVAQKRIEEGKVTLSRQMAAQWATPQSRDAKGAEGRMIREGQHTDLPSQIEVAPTGQWNRANGKLNPRWVETLMGLPIGWTMPSCKSPVTIAPTNSDCSETESFQQQQSELF